MFLILPDLCTWGQLSTINSWTFGPSSRFIAEIPPKAPFHSLLLSHKSFCPTLDTSQRKERWMHPFFCLANSDATKIRVSKLFRPTPKLERVSAEIIWIFAPLLCHCWAVREQFLEKLRSCKLFLEPKQLPQFVKMAQNSQKNSKY